MSKHYSSIRIYDVCLLSDRLRAFGLCTRTDAPRALPRTFAGRVFAFRTLCRVYLPVEPRGVCICLFNLPKRLHHLEKSRKLLIWAAPIKFPLNTKRYQLFCLELFSQLKMLKLMFKIVFFIESLKFSRYQIGL